eukprot:s590_g22.t1
MEAPPSGFCVMSDGSLVMGEDMSNTRISPMMMMLMNICQQKLAEKDREDRAAGETCKKDETEKSASSTAKGSKDMPQTKEPAEKKHQNKKKQKGNKTNFYKKKQGQYDKLLEEEVRFGRRSLPAPLRGKDEPGSDATNLEEMESPTEASTDKNPEEPGEPSTQLLFGLGDPYLELPSEPEGNEEREEPAPWKRRKTAPVVMKQTPKYRAQPVKQEQQEAPEEFEVTVEDYAVKPEDSEVKQEQHPDLDEMLQDALRNYRLSKSGLTNKK